MDLSSSSPPISPTPTNTSPNTDSQTPPPPPPPPPPQPPLFPQPIKSLSFAAINGSFNRQQPPKIVVSYSYRECLKNHAATIGGHALDGCGEFMPSPSSLLSDPTSLKCAACGCHRNFHRRHPEDLYHPPRHVTTGIHLLPSRPPPPLLLRRNSSPSPSLSPARSSSPGPSPTPSPTPSPHSPPSVSHLPPNYSSSSYFASPPQILLALSSGLSRPSDEQYQNLMNPTAHKMSGAENGNITNVSNARKRFRTKFSQEQKEKMCLFAEKLGWKMQRSEEKVVEEFCNEVGIRKGVLKVWMHNNKHTLGKRSSSSSADRGLLISRNVINNGTNVDDNHHNPHEEDTTDIEKDDEEDHRKANFNFFANGSSSSL
ncbi:hypothetical protein L484_001444 [Morus notabilis]|uniref:ZF-HD dimerization-type domain-containing protein n=2 Tax=Morus notabilis TaxID=981085 RepID=W9QW01_9ROSA|nr:hypothetical protein L484_001444 [Morus notabilis]